MKLLQKILYIFLFLFCVSSITAQDDFDVKLSETEVDNVIDAIIAARGLNFGDYIGGLGLSSWIANIDEAHVNILPNNEVELHIDKMHFTTEINVALFDFTIAEDINGVFNGEVILQGDESNGYDIILQINSIDNLSSWGDLGNIIGAYSSLFNDETILNFMPDISLSLADITPDLVTDIFDLGVSPISTDNKNIYSISI